MCVPFNERDVSTHKLKDNDIHEQVARRGDIKQEVNIIVCIYVRVLKLMLLWKSNALESDQNDQKNMS